MLHTSLLVCTEALQTRPHLQVQSSHGHRLVDRTNDNYFIQTKVELTVKKMAIKCRLSYQHWDEDQDVYPEQKNCGAYTHKAVEMKAKVTAFITGWTVHLTNADTHVPCKWSGAEHHRTQASDGWRVKKKKKITRPKHGPLQLQYLTEYHV